MRYLYLSITLLLSVATTQAQETVQDLSKKATKGFLHDVANTDAGYTLTYKIPGDKKKNEIFYEVYTFDKGLHFLKNEEISEPKQNKDDKPDKTVTGFSAYVGGCGSFDILSMKLKFNKYSEIQTWDYKKQRYVTSKTLTSETIKPKNDNGKVYGFAAFNDGEGNLFVLGGVDSKVNKKGTDFLVMSINSEYEISEKPADVSGSQTLVYSGQLDNGDVALVFAPKKGEADLTAYTFLRYGVKGDLKSKIGFKSPSSNLLIVDMSEKDGAVFFCATSTKSKDAYDEVFEEYTASITNPCYKEANNKQDFNWEKKSKEKMDSFHLLKFSATQLEFASTAAVNEFKAKYKASPTDKKGDPYKGSKFSVQEFKVTPSGEYLIAGQLTGTTSLGLGNPVKTYEDVICLHFDGSGQLKAQYGVEKMNDDKKSEIFPMTQTLLPSKDGRSFYWVVMEVKGFKGYANFIAAYNGSATYYPRYFPRIAKLDIQTTSLNSFKILGNEKFYTSKSFTPIVNAQENSLVFIGADEDYKKLWLSKYTFE